VIPLPPKHDQLEDFRSAHREPLVRVVEAVSKEIAATDDELANVAARTSLHHLCDPQDASSSASASLGNARLGRDK
jgi:hypothetical protein